MVPKFEVHLEDWYHGIYSYERWEGKEERFWFIHSFLMTLLKKYNIKAIFYILDGIQEKYPNLVKVLSNDGYLVGSHGRYHERNETMSEAHLFRQPYSWLGFTGGFWFRVLPLWFLKWQVLKHGLFYIHPHDLDEKHPKLKNPFMNWKRHVGLKGARKKLEKLLQEVKFE